MRLDEGVVQPGRNHGRASAPPQPVDVAISAQSEWSGRVVLPARLSQVSLETDAEGVEPARGRVVAQPRSQQDAPDVSRFLVDVARRVGASLDLQDTLDHVVRGVVELLGFEVAVLNLTAVDGSLEVVSVAGPDETREELMGTRQSAEGWTALLDAAEPLGTLRFVDHTTTELMEDMSVWTPDLAVSHAPGSWHPHDALFAPLLGADGDLLGVLSVDCPVDGMRPDTHRCELLELFAVQAALALDNARVHARLERSERVFRATFENAPVGMAVYGPDRRVMTVNRAYCTFLGRTESELVGALAADFNHPDDVETTEQVSLVVRERRGTVWKVDKRYVHADGSTVWGRLSLTWLDGEHGEYQVLAQVEDITSERASRTELERLAHTDGLTGLLNRSTVMLRLEAALAGQTRVAVLFCDVDAFKAVNDSFGHAVGDGLLVDIARNLQAVLRPGDDAGRLGGDEFVVILHDVRGGADALAVAERVRKAGSRVLQRDGTSVRSSMTIGVAVSQGEAGPEVASEILGRADAALYRAKQAGRNRSLLG